MSGRSIHPVFCLLAVLVFGSSAAWSMGPDPGGHTGDGVTPSTTKTGQTNIDKPTGSNPAAGNKTDESTGPTSGSTTQRGSTDINSPSQPKENDGTKKK
jgi:hypothetical protein